MANRSTHSTQSKISNDIIRKARDLVKEGTISRTVLAEQLGLGVTTVYAWCRRGRERQAAGENKSLYARFAKAVEPIDTYWYYELNAVANITAKRSKHVPYLNMRAAAMEKRVFPSKTTCPQCGYGSKEEAATQFVIAEVAPPPDGKELPE